MPLSENKIIRTADVRNACQKGRQPTGFGIRTLKQNIFMDKNTKAKIKMY